MGRWVKRVGIGLVVLAGLYVLAGAIFTSALLNHLLTPGSIDWGGYSNPNPPKDPFELGYFGDPQAALGLPFETVHYDTDLGPAEAWFVPAANVDGPWAIYVHGVGGTRENGYRQLSILHEAGIPTLMITYRNDRGAPADPNPLFSFGMTEWRDLDAAVSWVLTQGAPNVIVAAESMGGAIAGQFLQHSQQADRVVALALDAPALDFNEVVADKLGARALPFARTLAAAGVGVFDLYRGARLSDAVSLDTVAKSPGPVFLAHGTADTLVPITTSDRLVAERVGPITYLRTSANHLLSYKENPARYREEMLGWLRSLGD
ncbi:alpha/beta hydrolase [Devosia sp. CN2-171]|uniref:alpha/beta hydrolase n=1 Tax=Devosia sp. CN2-171 TaxID=3400909 RepID=UPI003BF77A6A